LIILKSPQEIEKMRLPCRVVAEILESVKAKVRPGCNTLELNDLAERLADSLNVKTAFKGYAGYPYAMCCSVNDQVVHGIPNKTPLKDGDILSLDFGVVANGYYGDAAITIPVGTVNIRAEELIRVTEQALIVGIQNASENNRLFDISSRIQATAEKSGFSVVRDFVGHGIGKNLHESPQVPNFGVAGRGIKLQVGMVLAIEPMINERGPGVRILDDGWTAVTIDGGLSAHFEHTVAITENGPEILTKLA
jgi:methionyl aminopeptidase